MNGMLSYPETRPRDLGPLRGAVISDIFDRHGVVHVTGTVEREAGEIVILHDRFEFEHHKSPALR